MKIIKSNDQKIVNEAVDVLNKGGLIIFPTETAYGAGVDATNETAVTKLLEYKKRPEGKAISVGVADLDMALKYVDLNNNAHNIYKEFLPGPVTVISKSKGKVDSRLESEKGTLGVRIPDNDLFLEISKVFGKPITTTSANSASKKTPYALEDIFENISNKQKKLIDLVIDAGSLPKNLTSSVIDTSTADLKTYRQGAINFENKKTKNEFKTNSEEETIELGGKFVDGTDSRDKPWSVPTEQEECVFFFLKGDLGAGKTHFTKGIAKALGINQTIKSPTYTYVSEYKIDDDSKLYHIDAWRIETKEDLEILNFEEIIKAGNVIVIEWPEIIINLIGSKIFANCKIIDLEFKRGERENERVIVERE